jgi:hypothetical protein
MLNFAALSINSIDCAVELSSSITNTRMSAGAPCLPVGHLALGMINELFRMVANLPDLEREYGLAG